MKKPTLKEISEVASFGYDVDGKLVLTRLNTRLIGKYIGDHYGKHYGNHMGDHIGAHYGDHNGDHIGDHESATSATTKVQHTRNKNYETMHILWIRI